MTVKTLKETMIEKKTEAEKILKLTEKYPDLDNVTDRWEKVFYYNNGS